MFDDSTQISDSVLRFSEKIPNRILRILLSILQTENKFWAENKGLEPKLKS